MFYFLHFLAKRYGSYYHYICVCLVGGALTVNNNLVSSRRRVTSSDIVHVNCVCYCMISFLNTFNSRHTVDVTVKKLIQSGTVKISNNQGRYLV